MSDLKELVDHLIQSQEPATFEQWVKSRSVGDQEAIHDALDYAWHTRSYRPAYRVLKALHENPWHGGCDAMRNYAIRRQETA